MGADKGKGNRFALSGKQADGHRLKHLLTGSDIPAHQINSHSGLGEETGIMQTQLPLNCLPLFPCRFHVQRDRRELPRQGQTPANRQHKNTRQQSKCSRIVLKEVEACAQHNGSKPA